MRKCIIAAIYCLVSGGLFAGNPIITDLYTADPAAMVYNDTVFLYTGHDEATASQEAYIMNDWQGFYSVDMVNWTSMGEVLNVDAFSWASGDAWAGQVIERNGKFYFYICAEHKTITGKAIGVAVSDSPDGPFEDAIGSALVTNDMTTYNSTWDDIDPTVYIDDDGQAYMYWGNSQCYYAKLKDNMIELDGDIHEVDLQSFTEAPYLHKANGIYYLSYAYGWAEQIAYATADSLDGEWTFQAVINDNVNNCNTNHQSIIEYKGQSYFIYHTGDLGGEYQRAVAVEYLFYNEDSTIAEIVQTTAGVEHVDTTADCPPLKLGFMNITEDSVVYSRSASVTAGNTIELVALTDSAGTWSWSGPSEPTSTDSSLTLENMQFDERGTYLATFTNECGTESYMAFDVEVNYEIPEMLEVGQSYMIQHIESGKVLTVKGGGTADGTDIIAAEYEEKSYQQFKLNYATGSYWGIAPNNVTTSAIDVYNFSTEDGGQIKIWDYWTGDCQIWQFAEIEDSVFYIINYNSEMCLDYNAVNSDIQQWTCNGDDSQKFTLVPVDDAVSSVAGVYSDDNKIVVYPNPASSKRVNIDLSGLAAVNSVEVYNVNGALTYSVKLNNENTLVLENVLKTGVYFVVAKSPEQMYTKKIIVQ